MKLRESTRRYILIGIVMFIVLGIVVAQILASNQDKQFATEELLYQQSSMLMNEGKYDEAYVYVSELLKSKSDSEAVNYLGALITANTDKMDQAVILFQKTLDINPYRVEDAMFMLQFGETLYNAERFEDAKTILTRCQEVGWIPEEFPEYQNKVAELLASIENKL